MAVFYNFTIHCTELTKVVFFARIAKCNQTSVKSENILFLTIPPLPNCCQSAAPIQLRQGGRKNPLSPRSRPSQPPLNHQSCMWGRGEAGRKGSGQKSRIGGEGVYLPSLSCFSLLCHRSRQNCLFLLFPLAHMPHPLPPHPLRARLRLRLRHLCNHNHLLHHYNTSGGGGQQREIRHPSSDRERRGRKRNQTPCRKAPFLRLDRLQHLC